MDRGGDRRRHGRHGERAVPDRGSRGAFARDRVGGTIVGVTGSVGKTGVKEAIFTALDRASHGAAHRSVKSYNNHVGVPLSLARMPGASAYGVFEMGMNHAGEIAALTAQVRPHVAVITTLAPARIENLGSEEAIADAKAEIFAGLGSRKELGDFAPAFHAQMAEPLAEANVDYAILVGAEMAALARELGKG